MLNREMSANKNEFKQTIEKSDSQNKQALASNQALQTATNNKMDKSTTKNQTKTNKEQEQVSSNSSPNPTSNVATTQATNNSSDAQSASQSDQKASDVDSDSSKLDSVDSVGQSKENKQLADISTENKAPVTHKTDHDSNANDKNPNIRNDSAFGMFASALANGSSNEQINSVSSSVSNEIDSISGITNAASIKTESLVVGLSDGIKTQHLSPKLGTSAWDQALAQKINWMIAGEEQTAEMTLNPPDLGPMQIVLNVNNDHANASFVSSNPDVRLALEAAMPKLKK